MKTDTCFGNDVLIFSVIKKLVFVLLHKIVHLNESTRPNKYH